MDVKQDAKQTLDARGGQYGGQANLECIAALKKVYRQYRVSNPGEDVFDHCMEMALVKLGRIITGVHKIDNYTDAVGYLELALRAQEGKQPSTERAKYHEAR